jgi:hypothetical protein
MVSSSGRLSRNLLCVRLPKSVDDSRPDTVLHAAMGKLGIGLSMSMEETWWKERDSGVGLCEARVEEEKLAVEAGEESNDRFRFRPIVDQ